MVRYDYRCTECATVFEVEHPMSEHPSVACPQCGAPAERVFSTSGIVLEGSGFYNTDQRGSDAASSASHKTDVAPAATDAASSKATPAS